MTNIPNNLWEIGMTSNPNQHYTHTWWFAAIPGQTTLEEALWAQATSTIRTMVQDANAAHKGQHSHSLVSGHTAHSRREYPGIQFNGKRPYDADEFELPATWAEALSLRTLWSCRTSQLPYDQLVTASLLVLRAIMGPERVQISSDGATTDWDPGLILAYVFCLDVPRLQIPENMK
jgi:hypothetical protein